MKVGIYFPCVTNMTGGPKRLALLCQSFVANGVNAKILTGSDSYKDYLDSNAIPLVGVYEPAVLFIKNRGLLTSNLFKLMRLISAVIALNIDFFRKAIRERFDIVIIRTSKAFMFLLPAIILLRLFRIVIVWDVDFEFVSGRLNWLVQHVSGRLACVLIFQDSYSRGNITSRHAFLVTKPCYVLTPGIVLPVVNEINTNLVNAQTVMSIVCVGSICPRKNQVFSLEIVLLLVSAGFAVRFTNYGVAADNEYYLRCREFVREHNMENIVEFIDWEDDPGIIYGDKDIIFLPSLNEGVPNALQEAMCWGVIPICSNFGGMRDVLLGFPFLCLDLDSETWFDTIRSILNSQRSVGNLNADIQSYATYNFDATNYARDYEKLLLGYSGL